MTEDSTEQIGGYEAEIQTLQGERDELQVKSKQLRDTLMTRLSRAQKQHKEEKEELEIMASELQVRTELAK